MEEAPEPSAQAESKENSAGENRKPIGKRLVYKAPPPPSNAAPVSKDVIENVKKVTHSLTYSLTHLFTHSLTH